MIIHVTSVKPKKPYYLELTFDNGSSGQIDIFDLIKKGGVFARLRDYHEFSTVSIDPIGRTVCWGKDLDLAPDVLWERLQDQKSWN